MTITELFHDQPLPCQTWSNMRFQTAPLSLLQISAEQIRFSFQYPLPRDMMNLTMDRWFMNHVTVLSFNIAYSPNNNPGKFYIFYSRKIYAEFNLATMLRMIKFTVLNISEFWLLDFDYKISSLWKIFWNLMINANELSKFVLAK